MRTKGKFQRLSCFKIVAALLMKTADTTRLQLLIEPFMPLLVREINRKSEASKLSITFIIVFGEKLIFNHFAFSLSF